MKNQQAVKRTGGKVLQPEHPIGPHDLRALILDSEGFKIGWSLNLKTDNSRPDPKRDQT